VFLYSFYMWVLALWVFVVMKGLAYEKKLVEFEWVALQAVLAYNWL